MDWFNIICTTLVCGFFAALFIILYDLLLTIEGGLGRFVDKLVSPLYCLLDFNVSFWIGTVLMTGIFLFSAGYVANAFLTASDILDPLLTVVTGTTIGSVIYLFATQFDFQGYLNYAAPIAVAFGSFFAYAYMKFTILWLKKTRMNAVLLWFLLVLMNVIFIAFSSLLSEDMTVFFSKAAQWLNTHFMQLHSRVTNAQIDSFGDALPLIGNILKLIPLALASIIVLLITVREYFASALYGLASLLILILVGVFSAWFFTQVVNFPIVSEILTYLSLFVIDYVRADETANQKFRDCIRKLSKKAIGIFLGFFGG